MLSLFKKKPTGPKCASCGRSLTHADFPNQCTRCFDIDSQREVSQEAIENAINSPENYREDSLDT